MADALAGHLHEIGKEPMILPTVEASSISSILRSKSWKNYRTVLKSPFPAVVPIGYKSHRENLKYLPNLPQLAKGFDVVIEIRAVNGHRTVSQIWVCGRKSTSLRCLYRCASIKFEDNLAKTA